MIKTIKAGVTHKGNVLDVGAIIDGLKAEDEERLVNDGWCEFVKKQKQSKTEKETEQEEQPKTEIPSNNKWL